MKKLRFFIVLGALLCNSLNAQQLHRVNNNTDFDADFTTLQAAVDAAIDNDTIYVEGSATVYDGATINKPLTIVGPGYYLDENPKTQANNVAASFGGDILFASGSDGSTIMACSFVPGYNVMISVSDITVIRNLLYGVRFDGTSNNILVAQNYVVNEIRATSGQITNSVISNNIVRGQIISGNTSASLVISNNIFWNSGWATPIDCYNASIQNNILAGDNQTIWQNSGNTISYNIMASAGTNSNGNQFNVDMATVFADFDGSLDLSTDGKWELKAGSPAIGAGISATDCGAFGEPAPYVLSGVPNLPHIYEAEVPATATSESGLQVTIQVKSGE